MHNDLQVVGPTPAELAEEAMRLVGVDAVLAETKGLEAVAAARQARDSSSESLAWRARGLAAREAEQLAIAESHLRTAVATAGRGDRSRAAEARMTLALVLLDRGSVGQARRLATSAVKLLSGRDQARARLQLALIEQRTGALHQALASYAVALAELRRVQDPLGEARLLNNRGILLAYQGQAAAAERDLVRSEAIMASLGQEAGAADAHWNQGFAAGLRGDAVTALRFFDEAGARLAAAGIERGAQSLDQCQVLLSVGLIAEARSTIEAGIDLMLRREADGDLAEARLLHSETLLAAGEAELARSAARHALTSFVEQRRTSLTVLARYAWMRASVDQPQEAGWSDAAATAAALRESGWLVAASDVDLLQTQRALALGEVVDPRLADAAIAAARRGPPGQRLRAWHVVALFRQSQHDLRGASAALLAGLRVHDSNRSTLAATELQVHTAQRAAALAQTGLTMALQSRRPQRVLAWSERWRAGGVMAPPPAGPRDAASVAALTELRAVTAELESARLNGTGVAALQRRQLALERLISQRARHQRTDPGTWAPTSLSTLKDSLGERGLVEYVRVGDALAAVVVVKGRSSLHDLGSLSAAEAEVLALRFALGRRARGGTPRMMEAVNASIGAGVERLKGQLLEPLERSLDDRNLVIVPSSALHVLPWGMLRQGRSGSVTVAPSAVSWQAAQQSGYAGDGHVSLVAGPGLPGAYGEIAAINRVYDAAQVLTEASATVENVLAELEGASCAHIAAHGSFRADNPLFSALSMSDGLLTVHDLETLQRPPALVVLSACDSGLSAVHPGDELMGVVAALLRMGTRTLVATIAPVPDLLARETMVVFHRALSAGLQPAAALRRAQSEQTGESGLAGAFVCYGAG